MTRAGATLHATLLLLGCSNATDRGDDRAKAAAQVCVEQAHVAPCLDSFAAGYRIELDRLERGLGPMPASEGEAHIELMTDQSRRIGFVGGVQYADETHR